MNDCDENAAAVVVVVVVRSIAPELLELEADCGTVVIIGGMESELALALALALVSTCPVKAAFSSAFLVVGKFL